MMDYVQEMNVATHKNQLIQMLQMQGDSLKYRRDSMKSGLAKIKQ